MWRSWLALPRAALLDGHRAWGQPASLGHALAGDLSWFRSPVRGLRSAAVSSVKATMVCEPRSCGSGLYRLGFFRNGSDPFVASTGCQQVRQIMVDVRNSNVDAALRKLKRKLREDGAVASLRDRRHYIKPAEQRVLDRKARDTRVAKKEFRFKLKWIMNRRSRGF